MSTADAEIGLSDQDSGDVPAMEPDIKKAEADSKEFGSRMR